MFGRNGQIERISGCEDEGLLVGGNATDTLPPHDRTRVFSERARHGADAAEESKDRDKLIHDHACAKNVHALQAINCTDGVQNFCMAGAVSVSVNIRLKELRKLAVPALSIRAMADALGIGHSRYAYFEDPKRFKKRALPLDLTRQIAAVLAEHGVDSAEIMKLAGLSHDEAEPEAREIEAQKPAQLCITLPVILPSEAALRDMFRSLLVLIPEGASKDEAAEILARRLPSGLAAIGPVLLDPIAAVSLAGEAIPRSPATDHPETGRSSHT